MQIGLLNQCSLCTGVFVKKEQTNVSGVKVRGEKKEKDYDIYIYYINLGFSQRKKRKWWREGAGGIGWNSKEKIDVREWNSITKEESWLSSFGTVENKEK